MVTQWAKDALLDGLHGLTGGTLTIVCPEQTHRFGQASALDATLIVEDDRFFLRALTGEIGRAHV